MPKKLVFKYWPYLKRNTTTVAGLGAVIFFAILAYGRIDLRAFWIDEAFTANITQASLSDFFKKVYAEGHPLAYTLLIKMWVGVWGSSEISFRSFSLVCALLLLIGVYKTSLYLFNDKRIALISIWLMATNYLLIWFSVQTRPYVFAALMCLISFYYLIKLIRKPQRLNYILYILFSALAIYSHFFVSLIFASQVLLALLFKKNLKFYRNLLWADLLVVILTIPNSVITISQTMLGAPSWVQSVRLSAFISTYKYLSYGSTAVLIVFSTIALLYYLYNQPNLRLAYDQNYQASKPIAVNKKEEFDFKIVISALALCCTLPIAIAVIVSQYKPFYVTARYETTLLPLFIILFAYWVSRIKSKLLLSIFVALLIYSAIISVAKDRKLARSYRSNDKTVAKDIYNKLEENDLVVTTDINLSTFQYYFRQFSEKDSKVVNPFQFPGEISLHPGWKNEKQMILNKQKYQTEASDLSAELQQRIGENGRIWLVYHDNSINRLLYDELSHNLKIDRIDMPAEPREPAWFEGVIVMKK